MSQKIKVKTLKPGSGVNHDAHGYIQYIGLATKNPFTKELKRPFEYVFWLPVDENGNTRNDVILHNGNELVELIDRP